MPTGGLVAIYAHPDDETFGVGGTMARYADQGVPLTMVCATRGEVGEIAAGSAATPETLGVFREQELRDAMAILGVTDVRFLDYRDSGMKGTDDNRDPRAFMNAPPLDVVASLVRVIRERRPDVIVTWDESGGYGHPDHVATHHHATAAFRAASDAAQFPDAGPAWDGASLFYTAIPMEEFARVMDEMRKSGVDVPDFGEDDEIASLPRLDPELRDRCQRVLRPKDARHARAQLADHARRRLDAHARGHTAAVLRTRILPSHPPGGAR